MNSLYTANYCTSSKQLELVSVVSPLVDVIDPISMYSSPGAQRMS